MNIVVSNNQLWITKKEGNNDITLYNEEICSAFFEISSKRKEFINFLLIILNSLNSRGIKGIELFDIYSERYRKAISEKSILELSEIKIPYNDIFVDFFNSFKKKENSKGHCLIIDYLIEKSVVPEFDFFELEKQLENFNGKKFINIYEKWAISEINTIIHIIQKEIRKLVGKINNLEIIDKLYNSKSYNDLFEDIAKYNFHIMYKKQNSEDYYNISDFTIPSKKYNYYAIKGSEIVNSCKSKEELYNSLKIVNEYEDIDIYDYFNICIDYLYTNKIKFNKCKNCKKYFIPKSKSNEELCHYIFKEGKTCSELSAKLKQETDIILNTYTSKYRVGNNKYNKLLKEKVYPVDLLNKKWEEWKKIMLNRRDEAYTEREKGKDINEIIKSYETWLKNHRFMGE